MRSNRLLRRTGIRTGRLVLICVLVAVFATGAMTHLRSAAQGTPESEPDESVLSDELCAKYLTELAAGNLDFEVTEAQSADCLSNSLHPDDGNAEVIVDPVTGTICGATGLGDAVGSVCAHVGATDITYHQQGGIPTGPAALLLIDPQQRIRYIRVTLSTGDKDYDNPQDRGLWLAAVVDETPETVRVFDDSGNVIGEFSPAEDAKEYLESLENPSDDEDDLDQ
jgi:hypothetical protein